MHRHLITLALLTAIVPGIAYSQDVAGGEKLFKQRCASCHSTDLGKNRVGPSLSGVVGRKPGTVVGAKYSAGMRSREGVWDAQTLDAFLQDPRKEVPGTTMPIKVPDDGQRKAIIAYLLTVGEPG